MKNYVSALYLLAEPSTSEEARQQALELARKGHSMTRSKAKAIINHYQEQAQLNAFNSEIPDNLDKSIESHSLAPFDPCKFPETHSLQLTDQADHQVSSIVTELSVEITPTIECHKILEQKTVEKINHYSREKSEVAAEPQLEPCYYIRILNIEHRNSELATNTAEISGLTFSDIRVDFEGNPEVLIILFEQMQKNPTFAKKILHEARLLVVNKLSNI